MYFVIARHILIHLLPYDMSKLRFSFCSRCYLFVNFPLPCQGLKNWTCRFETQVEISLQLSRTYHDRRYETARRIEIVSRFSRDERLDRTGSCLVELVCFNEMPLQVCIKYSIVRIKQRINTNITEVNIKRCLG